MNEEIPKFNISVTIIPTSTKSTVKMTRYTMEQQQRCGTLLQMQLFGYCIQEELQEYLCYWKSFENVYKNSVREISRNWNNRQTDSAHSKRNNANVKSNFLKQINLSVWWHTVTALFSRFECSWFLSLGILKGKGLN